MEEECAAQAELTLAASKGRFPLWQAIGEMAQGWVMVCRGQAQPGIALMEPGLALWEGTGANATAPYFRARLAEAHLLAGNRAGGLAVLEKAILFAEQAWWLPEEYRLHAELLLLAPGSELEAINWLREGLQIARLQQSKSLELRLCMSLARLLHTQGNTAEARDLLVGCYGWFSEGFETPDLRDARALLAELGHNFVTSGKENQALFAKFMANPDGAHPTVVAPTGTPANPVPVQANVA
jgi:predicted ATPase